MPRKDQCQLHKRIQCIFCHRPKKKPSKKRAEMVDFQDKCPEEGCTPGLLRPFYAGARYTTSFSDNFKSRISTQLLETQHPLGPSGRVSIRVILSTAQGQFVVIRRSFDRWANRNLYRLKFLQNYQKAETDNRV